MGPNAGLLGEDATPGDRFPRRVSRAVRGLASRQKPGGGVPAYMRWVNRRAGRYVAAVAFALGLRPNIITLMSLGFSALAMAVIIGSPASWWAGILGATLLASAFAFDSADGQLARLTGLAGPSGEWLDHVVDAVRTPALHLAVAVAAWYHFENGLLAVVALALSVAVSAQFMSQMLAEQLLSKESGASQRRGGDRQSWILLPTDPGVWAWIFVLWGSQAAFTVVYLTLAALNFIHMGVSMSRRYQDLVAGRRA